MSGFDTAACIACCALSHMQARNVSLNSKLYFWQVASAHYAINPKPELEDPLDLQVS